MKEVKDKKFSMRVSQSELDRWHELAEMKDMSLAALIRYAIAFATK